MRPAAVNDREKVRAPPTSGVDFEFKCAWQESNLLPFGPEMCAASPGPSRHLPNYAISYSADRYRSATRPDLSRRLPRNPWAFLWAS